MQIIYSWTVTFTWLQINDIYKQVYNTQFTLFYLMPWLKNKFINKTVNFASHKDKESETLKNNSCLYNENKTFLDYSPTCLIHFNSGNWIIFSKKNVSLPGKTSLTSV